MLWISACFGSPVPPRGLGGRRRGRDKHTGGAACRADRAVSAEKAGVCRSRAGPAARAAAWKGASPPFCPCRIAKPARGSPCLPSPARASPEPGEQQREAETGMGGMRRPASRGTGRDSGNRAGLCCPSGRMEPAGMRRHGRVLGSTRVCPARAWLPGLSPDRRRRRSRVPTGAWCRRGCRERPR